MNLRDLARSADTHLNDLQADVEAGSRHVVRICETGAQMEEAVHGDARLARLATALMTRMRELKAASASSVRRFVTCGRISDECVASSRTLRQRSPSSWRPL